MLPPDGNCTPSQVHRHWRAYCRPTVGHGTVGSSQTDAEGGADIGCKESLTRVAWRVVDGEAGLRESGLLHVYENMPKQELVR